MRKKCNYCGNMAKITIIHNDDGVRGSYCDLCGNFIEIPEKIAKVINDTTYSYRTTNSYSRYRRKHKKDIVAPAIVISITILIIIMVFQVLSIIFPINIPI